jgi:hypothetical protein
VGGGNPGSCGQIGFCPACPPPQNGGDHGEIYQVFDCFYDNGNMFCTVTFDALYPLPAVPGERASVHLEYGGGSNTRQIPAAAGWVTYSISVDFCSRATTIAFILEGPAGGTTTTLKIDNVSSECTSTDETSAALGASDAEFVDAGGPLPDTKKPKKTPLAGPWGLGLMGAFIAALVLGRMRRQVPASGS